MRRFLQRALNKLNKLDHDQLQSFIMDLAKENDRLGLLLDSMSDGVLACDKAHRFLLSNKAVERHLPLRLQTTAERLPIWDLINDSAIARFVRETLLAQESVTEKEFILSGLSSLKVISVSVLPLVSHGRIEGTILLVRDISERRRQETKLRQSENLAKLSTLAAGVAHEIKNPLGSISIHIQLFQRCLAQQAINLPADVNDHLVVAIEEIERLNRIVVDFLFALRPLDAQLLKANLNPLLSDVLNFMRPELDLAKIGVTEQLSPNLPDILMDERHIKQALLNLINNAVNAMPQGGKLTVRTYRSSKVNQEVVLEIADTGVGMSAEVLEKIFEPFFTTRNVGSGIGLTLVFKIIKEHGGEIAVTSAPGQGTTFTISFPAVPASHRLLRGPDPSAMKGLPQPAESS